MRINKKYTYMIITILLVFIMDIIYNNTDIRNTFSKEYKVEKILSIHDGDTLHLIDEYGKKRKIRLYGIDAPEIKQKYGRDSKKCLENLTKNGSITYQKIDKDKYGRIVAVIYNGDININREMIKQGCAWSYFRYSRSIYNEYLQLKAKELKKGLWQNNNPVAPWEYRKSKK